MKDCEGAGDCECVSVRQKRSDVWVYGGPNRLQTLTYASNLIQHFKVAIPHTRPRQFYQTQPRDMLDLAFSGSEGPEI